MFFKHALERREREELENNHEYIARIVKHQGKKVRFKVNDYYNISIDKIGNIPNLKKDTMKELLPLNSEWKIKRYIDGEKELWDFVPKEKTNH